MDDMVDWRSLVEVDPFYLWVSVYVCVCGMKCWKGKEKGKKNGKGAGGGRR